MQPKPKKQKRKFRHHVKHYGDKKNRRETRQALDRGDFDALSLLQQAKRESRVWV